MNQKRIILSLLLSRKRIDITSKNYFAQIRVVSFVVFLIIAVANLAYLYVNGLSFLSLAISGGNLMLFGLLFKNLLKNTSSTSIKGDTLILNSSKNRACVTSLRSVKRVQTSSLLNINITHLSYNLDGKDRKTVIFTRKNATSFTPEKLLNKAILLSKKQKANHKPGPVTV